MYGRRQPSASSSSAMRELAGRPRKVAIALRWAGGSGAIDSLVASWSIVSPSVTGGLAANSLRSSTRVSESAVQPAASAMWEFQRPRVVDDDDQAVAMSG